MQSVTSNAVAEAISQGIKRKWTETKTPSSGGGSNITWTCLETYGGVKICFGSATSARTSSAFGDIFYCSGRDDQWYYPSNFFTSTPLCLMEVSNQVSSGTNWFGSGTQTRGTDKTKTKMVCPACPVNFSNETVYYNILAIGY